MGDREVNQIFRHADADDDKKVRVVRVCVRARADVVAYYSDEDRDSTRSTSTHGAVV